MKSQLKGALKDPQRIFFILWSIIGAIILVGLLFAAMIKIEEVITLFLYAFILVYLIFPVFKFLEGKKVPRFVAVILSYMALLFIFALIVIAVAPPVVSQISGLIEKLPDYFLNLENLVEEYRVQFASVKLSPELIDYIGQALTSLGQNILKAFSLLPGQTAQAFSFIFSVIIKPIFAIILSFYILMDYETVLGFFLNLPPKGRRKEFEEVMRTIDLSLKGFLKGQFIVILATATLSWIAFLIFGVEYALALAVIIGIFDIIPYFGPIIGGGLAIIVAFFQSPITALWVGIAMFGIQQVEAFFISPNVMGKQVDLHPLAVIVALLIGGSLMGPLGFLLAIPVAASIKGLYLYYYKRELLMEDNTISNKAEDE